MFTRLASVLATAASFLLYASAPAALILYEGFDYATPGNVTGQTGGVGWPAGTAWQGSASMSLVSPGLEYLGIASSGNAAEVSTARAEANYRAWNSDLFAADGGVLWFSFLFSTSATTSDLRVFPLGATGTAGAGVFVLNNTVRADINSQRSDSLTFDYGETNLVVARLQFSDTPGEDSVRVWLNPSLDQEPTTDYVEQKGDFPVFTSGDNPLPYNVFVRGGGTWGGIVDALRLETTFFGAEPVFKLDFNGLGAETQAGYFAMATDPANENRAFTDAATFSHVFGPGEHVGVEFDGDRAKRRNPLTGGPYQDLSQLLRDWYGVSTGEFSVSLSLPLGTYQLTSYHHDVLVGAGQSISITLNDAAGTSTATAVQTGGTAPDAIGSFTGNVTSDGTEAITLTYASSSQIGINGLHLEPFGFWSNPSGGLWSDSSNWMHGHVAEGAGTIAGFRAVNIWDDVTVSLDSSRSLHGLAFGNLDPASPAGWIIDDNGSADNTITLAGTAPVVTVNELGSGKTAEIAVRLAGTGGLRKDGPGTLVLARENTYTGPTEVAAGTLKLGPNGTIPQSGAIAVRAGATLDVAQVTDGFSVVDGQTISGAGSIAGQTTIASGAVLAPGDSIGTLTFSNDLILASGATIDWEFLNADTPGIHYDSIAGPRLVLPNVAQGITLNITGLNGHSLHPGDTFSLLQGGTVTVGGTTLSPGTDITNLFSITDHVGWSGGWKVTTGSLAITAVDPTVEVHPMFKLDFNGANGPTQAGYDAMSYPNATGDFDQEATFANALGPGEGVTVAFEGNRARNRGQLTGGLHSGPLGQSGLLQDWYGKHYDDGFSLALTLPPGTYKLTSFHHDALGGTYSGAVTVSDALDTHDPVTFTQTGGYEPVTIGTFTANITSSGAETVTLTYAAAEAIQIGINGLHIEPFGFWADGQSGLWSDTSNWMHGHLAEGAGTIASFRVVDPTNDVVVNLDSSRTLYGLAFGDLDPASPAGWKIDNNGDPANTITLSAAPSTITVNALGAGKAAEIAVRLEGAGGIVKDGPGTLVLSGDNTYTGATDIAAGTLKLGPAGSIAQSSAITVHPDALLDVADASGGFSVPGGQTLAGSGTVLGDTAIGAGGALQPGMSIGKLTFEDNLTLDDGAVWNWEFVRAGTGGIDYDKIAGSTLILPANLGSEIELNVFGLPGHSVTWYEEFTILEGEVENFSAGLFRIENDSDWTRGWRVSLGEGGSNLLLTAVPEPGAWMLLLWTLAGGLLVRRRNK
ncbi:MAG: autotransporter-associated beta strand repeat-containing protein [Thermoguttaceae bacterium]|jgi:autotransporter-associated beta strand protein|nr:autotransporter-associated beta strand repeat-containing protein [Thermoguttaceae bacterium]